MPDLQTHHNLLLLRRRCGWCAEAVPLKALLRADACSHCGASLQPAETGAALHEALAGRWVGRRVLGYGLVTAASFVSGTVPLLQSAVLALGLLVLHVFLVRNSLGWLLPARRVAARFTIKLVGALLTALAFVLNIAVAPLVGVSSILLGLLGLVSAVVYVETALWLIQRRVAWETEGRPLQKREWLLPAGLGGGLLCGVSGSIGAAVGGLHLLANAELPGVSTLAEWMLHA